MITSDLVARLNRAHERCVDTQARWARAAALDHNTNTAYAAYERAEAAFDKALARLIDAAKR